MRSILIHAATAGLAGTVTVYAAAIAGCAAHYVIHCRRCGLPRSCAGFVIHAFPSTLLRSRWTRIDTAVFLTNKLLFVLLLPSGYVLVILVANSIRAGLLRFGIGPPPVEPGPLLTAAFGFLTLLARDFAGFYTHLFQHRIPLLWEFHKVHHAPETLVPMTSLRLHPLELVVNTAAESALLGLLAGFWGALSRQDASQLALQAAAIYTIVNVITLSPLRHSHIDIRFGWVERVILSPAHHQLHHSVEMHHWDKNFAAMFTLWDWWWNTLEQPPSRESYRLGLPDGESNRYATWLGCYIAPFANMWRRCREAGLRPSLTPGPVVNHPPPVRATEDP